MSNVFEDSNKKKHGKKLTPELNNLLTIHLHS